MKNNNNNLLFNIFKFPKRIISIKNIIHHQIRQTNKYIIKMELVHIYTKYLEI